jgi:hypothetical protein
VKTILSDPKAAVIHGTWREQLEELERTRMRADGTVCDLMAPDAPYSPRVHDGHDVAPNADGVARKLLPYAAWRDIDVERFVDAWAPVVRGWWTVLTDHQLGRAWERELERAGLYVFAPLPMVIPGMTVRRRGDGPSSVTVWVIVARPRTVEFSSWGTMRGEYRLPQGVANDAEVPGGKPTYLLQQLVEDYSRPGDVVADPVCGAGTAGVAARRLGRVFVGGDADEARASRSAERIAATREQLLVPLVSDGRQVIAQQACLPEVG